MPINADQIVKTGIYATRAPLEVIAGEMDEIEALRLRRITQLKTLVILAIIACLGGAVLLGVNPWIGVPVLLGFAGLIYAAIVTHRGTPNTPDRIRLVKGLTSMLANDTSAKTPVSVWMSFDRKGTTLSEHPWPNRKNGKERHANCNWLRLDTSLLDGTEFAQTIVDLIRERTYTNPRGKRKTKRRAVAMVVQRYRFPAETYGDPTNFSEEIRQLVHLPQSATLRGLRVGGKALTARVKVKAASDLLPSCTMLSLGVYRIFNLARRVALQGGAK